MAKTRTPRRGRQATESGKGVNRNDLILFLLAVGIVGLTAVGQVYFQGQVHQEGLAWTKTREKLETLRRQRDNLMMERERCTQGPFVIQRALGMGLRPAASGQVRRLKLLPPQPLPPAAPAAGKRE